MKTISLREFQLHASQYIKELQVEKELVLTQYNLPVAKLVPADTLVNRSVSAVAKPVTEVLTPKPEPKVTSFREEIEESLIPARSWKGPLTKESQVKNSPRGSK